MSCSKPLRCPPDVLRYLNRDQIDVLCGIKFKAFWGLYFSLNKPFRVLDTIQVKQGKYAIFYRGVKWHPNRDDYSVQQFLAGQRCYGGEEFYSFAEMRPYLGPTIRTKECIIHVGGQFNAQHVAEMESIAYLWRESEIRIVSDDFLKPIVSQDFQLILNSPTILRARKFSVPHSDIAFYQYNVFLAVEVMEICYSSTETVNHDYWLQFFEQPGLKPLVILQGMNPSDLENLLDQLSQVFLSDCVQNHYTVIIHNIQPLVDREYTSFVTNEKLELKKGLPTGYSGIENFNTFTFSRSKWISYDPKIMPAVMPF